jgi:carbon-monoxide dehydrogenase small subunit
MTDATRIVLTVNGVASDVEVDPRCTLADFLREHLRLTGTHLGCEHGVCGACTVLIDGSSARSCLVLAVQAHGTEVTTVEGLADGDELHPLQAAFQRDHALQCGFCTPGFLMTATELLEECDVAALSDAQIREAISGNLCRCTGYENVVTAIRSAVRAGR